MQIMGTSLVKLSIAISVRIVKHWVNQRRKSLSTNAWHAPKISKLISLYVSNVLVIFMKLSYLSAKTQLLKISKESTKLMPYKMVIGYFLDLDLIMKKRNYNTLETKK